MKKMMFALACAAACAAAWADPADLDAIGFEAYAADTVLVNGMDDAGSTDSANAKRFAYSAESGSVDASTVKAFDTAPSTPATGVPKNGFQSKYLELATEGGTLWRAINAPSTVGDISTATGYSIPADGVFIDTMVQFTPTEDGADQTVGADDKLAIWLNVDTANNTTNLMVKACQLGDGDVVTPTVFTITNFTVDAGQWYRLTVKAVPCVDSQVADAPAFQIWLDKTLLAADLCTFDAGYAEFIDWIEDADIRAAVYANTMFIALGGPNASKTLTAVGFKGSGMIDDYVVTEIDPINQGGGSYDFTLSWDSSEISAVKYVIEGSTNDATSGATVTLQAAATVSLIATPQNWYVLDDASVADFLVDSTGIEKTITATEADSSTIDAESMTAADLGITGGAFASASTATLGTVVDWAIAAGKTPADVSAMTFTDSASYTTDEKMYLLDVDDPDDLADAIDDAEDDLALTIAPDGLGGFTVETVLGDEDGDSYGNGTIEIRTATTPEGPYTTASKTGDSLFYKAVLVFE